MRSESWQITSELYYSEAVSFTALPGILVYDIQVKNLGEQTNFLVGGELLEMFKNDYCLDKMKK